MGKTKITTKEAEIKGKTGPSDPEVTSPDDKKTSAKKAKKKVTSGILHIDATFNNTKVLFSDKLGNSLFWSSAGSLGFRGAKKGTPFAASKVGDLIGNRATTAGVKDADVIVLGVGSGREPAIRAFMAHGIEITSIKDATPVPHNGPKAKKPRRV
ncbi:MAG: 30S ribosomal protein S11 [Candidatus Paceibacterota bacterium]